MKEDKAIWHIYQNNSQYGPFRKKDILRFIGQNQIKPSAYVFKEGDKSWRPFGEVIDFKHFFFKPQNHDSKTKEPSKATGGTPESNLDDIAKIISSYEDDLTLVDTALKQKPVPPNSNAKTKKSVLPKITDASIPFIEMEIPPRIPVRRKNSPTVSPPKPPPSTVGLSSTSPNPGSPAKKVDTSEKKSDNNHDQKVERPTNSEFIQISNEPDKTLIESQFDSVLKELESQSTSNNLDTNLSQKTTKELNALSKDLNKSVLSTGKIRKLTNCSIILPLLSLGLYVIFWVVSICDEITLHLGKASPKAINTIFFSVFLFIPGTHLIFAYLLGKSIKTMVEDDIKHKCTPWRFTLYWIVPIIPFFFMHYTQKHLNRHWQFHQKKNSPLKITKE